MFSSIKQRLMADDMVKHGLMMAAFSSLAGLLNYLYQLFMGILLSPVDYGTLFSLTSMFTIIMVFSQAIQISIAKFTSTFKGENSWGSIKYLWTFSLKRAFVIGVVIFLILALLSPMLSRFLNLDNNLYPIILFSSLILLFTLAVNYGVLQGLQRFMPLGFSNSVWPFFELILAIVLVYSGFGIYGSLVPFLLATVITFIVTNLFLKDLAKVNNRKDKLSGLFSYTGLALLAIFSFAVVVNIDVVLAKHFLSPEAAGNYSVISLLGRVALYAPIGIVTAMFPKTSELFETGVSHSQVLWKAMLLMLLLSGVVVIAYWLFPGTIVDIFFGSKYPLVAPYVLRYGLAMALFALSFLLVNYFLSLNQTKVAYLFFVAMLFEVGLLNLFHDSIGQFVNVMLLSGAFCLALMFLYYLTVRPWKNVLPR